MKKSIQKLAKGMGFSITRTAKKSSGKVDSIIASDIKESEFHEIYELCKPFTMTSVERMYSLYCSVKFVLNAKIPGAFIECGVWRGGSAMLIAKMLSNRNITDRKIYLYDTFEGMSEPTSEDVESGGKSASVLLEENKNEKETSVWCLANLTDVKKNLGLINYPSENIIYVKGKVEETISSISPETRIALLRLDTDWYESTRHELIHLFPKLEINGVLIIDDYGHWEGCRKAVDEYFSENKISILLNRIDYTGRVGVKTEEPKSI